VAAFEVCTRHSNVGLLWDAARNVLLDDMRRNQRVRMHASGVLEKQSVEDGSFEKGNHPEGCICHTQSAALDSCERLVELM
jgi:hypothetical protein